MTYPYHKKFFNRFVPMGVHMDALEKIAALEDEIKSLRDLANARLIAAAPDMYAALKAIAYLTDHALTAMPRGEQVAMVKAIAKAEGK